MCVSPLEVSNLGLAIVRSLMDYPSFLSAVVCRMLCHVKEMGKSSLQQGEGQTSCRSTLAVIEFAEITQSDSSAELENEARAQVESDIPA